MKRKNIITIIVRTILLSLAIFGICIALNNEKVVHPIVKATNITSDGEYSDINDLLKAPYIVEGKVINISKPFTYENTSFVEIKYKVTEVIHSEKAIEKTFTILREWEKFIKLQKNQEYILYLYDYEGPIAENVKKVCGDDLGVFEIVRGKSKNNITLEEYKNNVKKKLHED